MAPSQGSSSGVANAPKTEIVSSPVAPDAEPSSPVVPPQALSTRADTARPAMSPGRVLPPSPRRPVVRSTQHIEDMALPPSDDPGGRLAWTLGPRRGRPQGTGRHFEAVHGGRSARCAVAIHAR